MNRTALKKLQGFVKPNLLKISLLELWYHTTRNCTHSNLEFFNCNELILKPVFIKPVSVCRRFLFRWVFLADCFATSYKTTLWIWHFWRDFASTPAIFIVNSHGNNSNGFHCLFLDVDLFNNTLDNWKNLPGFVVSPAISVVPIFPPIANIVPICCWKPALEMKEGKKIELDPRL